MLIINVFFLATNAYNDLVDILQHPDFNTRDVVTNVRRFRQWRQRLPLMPIRSRPIKINQKKTPSTSKGIKLSYYLSIFDIRRYKIKKLFFISEIGLCDPATRIFIF